MGTKAVGFDLDGTLYPAHRLYFLSAGLALRHPRLVLAYGEGRRALRKESLERPFLEGWRTRQAVFVAKRLGMAPEDAASGIDEWVYEAMDSSLARLRPFPDLRSCLERLKAAGLRLGLLSDLPPRAKLEALGLADLFEVALCSEDSGALKPSPLPFRALADALGVEPAELAYVGNKYELDCAGAKALGMRTALLGSRRGPAADLSFRSWKALGDWVLGQKA